MPKNKEKIWKLINDRKFIRIAGPCAIESEKQLSKTAMAIKNNIDILRGGAYKPRSKPGSFEGLKKEGLKILNKVGKKINKPVVTEVIDTRDVSLISGYTDILQIGTRNMSNFELVKESGRTKKPILLKRGFGSTVEEWLSAKDYILKSGNNKIILCERGIRTFETSARFTLDLAGALIAKNESNLKVIIDPSHATGKKELIGPVAKASKASGLDGIMIEVHYKPQTAKCDAEQALTPKEYNKIIIGL